MINIFSIFKKKHNETNDNISNDIEEKDDDKLKEYYKALEEKDPDTMYKALIKFKNKCKHKNSNCLVEVFCPDCPFGGLIVTSGRVSGEVLCK